MARGFPDFSFTGAGIYLMPEWAAKEATDKNFFTSDVNVATDGVDSLTYVVPTGKVLYITQFYCFSIASADADKDNNQIFQASLYKSAPGLPVYYVAMGGNGGGGFTLPKPAVFTAGQTMTLDIGNYANHDCDIGVGCNGYEI